MNKAISTYNANSATLATLYEQKDAVIQIVKEFQQDLRELKKKRNKCISLWNDTKVVCEDYLHLLGGLAIPDTLASLKSLEGQMLYLESATRVAQASEGDISEEGAQRLVQFYEMGMRQTAEKIILNTTTARDTQCQLLCSIKQLRDMAENERSSIFQTLKDSAVEKWTILTASKFGAGSAAIGANLLIDSGLIGTSGSLVVAGVTFPPIATMAAAGCVGFLLVALATLSIKFYFKRSREQIVADLDRLIEGISRIVDMNQTLARFLGEATGAGNELKKNHQKLEYCLQSARKEDDMPQHCDLTRETIKTLIDSFENIRRVTSPQQLIQ